MRFGALLFIFGAYSSGDVLSRGVRFAFCKTLTTPVRNNLNFKRYKDLSNDLTERLSVMSLLKSQKISDGILENSSLISPFVIPILLERLRSNNVRVF